MAIALINNNTKGTCESHHACGDNFKVTVTKYTDEDLDIVTDQLNLEIKSDKLIRQGDVLNGISSMFHRGIFSVNIETVDY